MDQNKTINTNIKLHEFKFISYCFSHLKKNLDIYDIIILYSQRI